MDDGSRLLRTWEKVSLGPSRVFWIETGHPLQFSCSSVPALHKTIEGCSAFVVFSEHWLLLWVNKMCWKLVLDPPDSLIPAKLHCSRLVPLASCPHCPLASPFLATDAWTSISCVRQPGQGMDVLCSENPALRDHLTLNTWLIHCHNFTLFIKQPSNIPHFMVLEAVLTLAPLFLPFASQNARRSYTPYIHDYTLNLKGCFSDLFGKQWHIIHLIFFNF